MFILSEGAKEGIENNKHNFFLFLWLAICLELVQQV